MLLDRTARHKGAGRSRSTNIRGSASMGFLALQIHYFFLGRSLLLNECNGFSVHDPFRRYKYSGFRGVPFSRSTNFVVSVRQLGWELSGATNTLLSASTRASKVRFEIKVIFTYRIVKTSRESNVFAVSF